MAIVGFVLLHSDVIEIVPSHAFQRAVAWAFLRVVLAGCLAGVGSAQRRGRQCQQPDCGRDARAVHASVRAASTAHLDHTISRTSPLSATAETTFLSASLRQVGVPVARPAAGCPAPVAAHVVIAERDETTSARSLSRRYPERATVGASPRRCQMSDKPGDASAGVGGRFRDR